MEHESHVPKGSPYNHTAPITCPDCIAMMVDFRKELCIKHGWSQWPDDLKGALVGE